VPFSTWIPASKFTERARETGFQRLVLKLGDMTSARVIFRSPIMRPFP